MRIKKMIGEKCYLSPINLDDIPLYMEWLNNEEVFQYLLVGTSVISYEIEKRYCCGYPRNMSMGS